MYLRDKYANIATLATFFSSITASTLQFSFDQGTSNLWVAINTLWFLSLVSSIASAANALLAITWHKSLRFVPLSRLHLWYTPLTLRLPSLVMPLVKCNIQRSKSLWMMWIASARSRRIKGGPRRWIGGLLAVL